MIRFLSLLSLLFLCIHCKAQLPLDQQHFADSLNNILRTNPSDSIKARTNYLLVYFWAPRDTQKAKQCIEEGRRLSKNYPYLYALSYAHEGYLFYATDIARAEAALMKSDSLLSRFTFKEAYLARSNTWTTYAALQQRKDDDKAHVNAILNKAIPLALKAGDSVLVGSQYASVGVAFMNLEQYDKAEIYLNSAIWYLKHLKAQATRLISAYNRAGENYMLLKKYDKAKLVLDTVRTMLADYPESEYNAGFRLVEAMYFHHLKSYDAALASIEKGIAAAGGPNKAFIIEELLFMKARVLVEAKKYAPALQVLTQLSADEDAMSIDKSRLQIYEGLAKSYAGLGKMADAYKWQERYIQLNDSLHDSNISNDINTLEAKYKDAEQQKEIVTLKARHERAEMADKNNRLIIGYLASVSLLLLMVAAFAWLYYRNNKKLSQQKELNYQQQLKDIEQQQQLQFGKAILQGEEQERHRLARDLHDGLGGMLAGVKINLSGQANVTSGNKEELQKIIGQVDNSVTELRRIAHNMMPVNLLKFGLQTALKDLCESLMTDKTRIDFQAYDIQENMPEQTQLHIYRIVQETLANAIRHANATNIMLQCSQNGGTFLITQEDNGIGFDTAAGDHQKGIGLSNIKNRVGFLKGTMEIESTPNEGTTINIELHVG